MKSDQSSGYVPLAADRRKTQLRPPANGDSDAAVRLEVKQAPEAILELDAMPAAIPEDVEALRDEGLGRVILVKRPRCPYCGTQNVRCYKTTPGGRLRYYQCTRHARDRPERGAVQASRLG